jgi:hypothetical protein
MYVEVHTNMCPKIFLAATHGWVRNKAHPE